MSSIGTANVGDSSSGNASPAPENPEVSDESVKDCTASGRASLERSKSLYTFRDNNGLVPSVGGVPTRKFAFSLLVNCFDKTAIFSEDDVER